MYGGTAQERLARHAARLETLQALPKAERDWIVRGSIEYHSDCIRHLKGEMAGAKKKRNGK